MANVNKNRKYLEPVQRRGIADSIGVSGSNFRQDLPLLQLAEMVRILLDFNCFTLVPLLYFGVAYDAHSDDGTEIRINCQNRSNSIKSLL